MARLDLLALSADDLAELTNRGTVKRAQKEADTNEPRGQIAESSAGQVTVSWSDGTVCDFPAGGTIHDARCSSGTLGISRHVVRSVFLYQRIVREAGEASARGPSPALSETSGEVAEDRGDSGPSSDVNDGELPTESANQSQATLASEPAHAEHSSRAVEEVAPSSLAANAPWDPGEVSDAQLVECFGKTVVAKARSRFEQGVLVELTRGSKPVARFLDEASTVRFMVPGDARYATADCAESQWGIVIPLAVWSFRELPAQELAGLVALRQGTARVASSACEAAQSMLREFATEGLARLSEHWEQRWRRTEVALREEGLIWPADLALELGQQVVAYRERDARFDVDEIVQLFGELQARLRALRQGTSAVIPALVRGSRAERPVELKGARLTGLGLNVAFRRKQTILRAFLYEASQGNVVAVEREFAEGASGSSVQERSVDDLASTVIVRGLSLGGLAVSQLLVQTAKRTPNGRLALPRSSTQMTIHPQQFSWETWKPPFAVDSVAQLRARLRLLPPSYLRARRCTEDFFGVAVSGCDGAGFDVTRQVFEATVRDSEGEPLLVAQPYFQRASRGFRRLVHWFTQQKVALRFVCGQVRAARGVPVIRPTLLVFGEGRDRVGVAPWLDGALGETPAESVAEKEVSDSEEPNESDAAPPVEPNRDSESVVERFWGETRAGLGELLITGISVVTPREARLVEELASRGARIGFVRVASELSGLAAELSARSQSLRWDPSAAVIRYAQLCCLARMASE